MELKHSANIRQPLNRRCAALGIPSSGFFELTPRCNLKCGMCYVRLTPEQMAPMGRERTAEEWLQLGRQARDAGMVFLLLTGGEPTLRRDFPRIYEGLAKLGLSISINTNGTLLTPALRELWHRLPPAQVNVTLYGLCREDYQALCGSGDAFDAVVDALDWLRREGILVHLNATMNPASRSRLPRMVQFARDRGLELRTTAYCFPPVRREEACGSCPDFSRLSPEAAAEAVLEDQWLQGGAGSLYSHYAQLGSASRNECALETGEPIGCFAGRSQFWVTWDGRMTPCGMLTQPVVEPFAEGFCPAWEALRRQTAAIRLCPDCADCPDRGACLNCAAVTYTETGRFDARPEYMCRMARAYRDRLTAWVAANPRQETTVP